MLYCMQLYKIDASKLHIIITCYNIIYNTIIIAGNNYIRWCKFLPISPFRILNIRTAQDSDVEPIVVVLIFG